MAHIAYNRWLRTLLLVPIIALALRLEVYSSATAVTLTRRAADAREAPNAPLAPDALAWYNGQTLYSTITNCASIIWGNPYQEYGAGVYSGFLADPQNGQPAPNSVYYVHVLAAGMGNACSGMRFYVDVQLPNATALAIDATNKLRCWAQPPNGTWSEFTNTTDCPQSLPPSSYDQGAYEIPSTDSAHANLWPLPQGAMYDFWIPVKSTTTLSNSPFQANIWVLDGNSSPWLRPTVGVYVFSSQPTILYPTPSTITITATTARSQAYLYAFGITGTGYFDLGYDTGYTLTHDPVAITTPGTAWLAWDDWGPPALTPDTLYHWRFTFTPSGGQTLYGADQTFRTLADGRVIVGDGTPGACTDAALTSALKSAKDVRFDCGTLPITITLSAAHTITANVSIAGDNKVTLASGGAWPHFRVSSGVALSLTQISLVNGVNNSACGGSVDVANGARLYADQARFFDDSTSDKGGAVCVEGGGAADIRNSVFLRNRAVSGGAIFNQGTLALAGSTFADNSASDHGAALQNWGVAQVGGSQFARGAAGINGGAIDTTVVLTVSSSTFISNSAVYRGGAINNFLGMATVLGSSVISNTSSGYGGGLVNDGGTVSVQASSFLSNTAQDVGGGIKNDGPLSVSLSTFANNRAARNGGAIYDDARLDMVNSTLSRNSAQSGGALYWLSGTVTILNSTLAGNVASGTGGNVRAGAVTNTVSLKNTIMASGMPNNCDAAPKSQGHNLESANDCGLTGPADQVNANANLGPLQNNGGTTLTRALLPGSKAIDAGDNNGCPPTDQRGVPRPQGSACDIGAVEMRPGIDLFPFLYLPLITR